MRLLLTSLGIAAAVTMMITSAVMNYWFVSSLARSALEGQMLGAVSVAADVLKGLLLCFLAGAVASRRRVYLVTAFAFLLIAVAISLSSAYGFLAANRTEIDRKQTHADRRLADARDSLAELRREIDSLPSVRPVATLEEALNASRLSPSWRSSKGCTDVTLAASRHYCEQYFQLRREKSAAVEAVRLQHAIAAARAQLTSLEDAEGSAGENAQTASIAALLNSRPETVRTMLLALLSVLVELGSTAGVYLATAHGYGDSRRGGPEPVPRGLGRKVVLARPLPMR